MGGGRPPRENAPAPSPFPWCALTPFLLFLFGERGKQEIRESHYDGRTPHGFAPDWDRILACHINPRKTNCRHNPSGSVCSRINESVTRIRPRHRRHNFQGVDQSETHVATQHRSPRFLVFNEEEWLLARWISVLNCISSSSSRFAGLYFAPPLPASACK